MSADLRQYRGAAAVFIAASAISSTVFGQFTTDASAPGTPFNRDVRGQAAPATETTRGDWPTGVNGALSVSRGSSFRGVAGGLEADLYDWRTSNNQSREGTLNYLRYSRDYNSELYITANIRGLVEPDPNTPGNQRFYDTSISTMASVAADWVRYTNRIVPTYRQGQAITDTRDQAVLNSIVWNKSGGGTFDELLTSTEAAVPKVKYWEIGNEPRVGLLSSYRVTNSYTFWTPSRGEDATHKTDFTQRYAAIASAMLAEDPTIKVGPAIQWLSSTTEQELMIDLLKRQPDGNFIPVDFLGYHPYQKLQDQTTPTAKENFLRGVYDDHLAKINGIRSVISAAGRDPNSIALVASEQNVSDWRANETPNEANMAHALGVIETDFAFARLGLQGAHYWIWPNHAWDGTQYPSYLAFQKLQDHMGDKLLGVSAHNLDNLHLYSTSDSVTGEIALWGLNLTDSLAVTRSTPIVNVGGRGKITRYTLGATSGTTNFASSNLASDMTGGPSHNVDWTTVDLTGQRLDTLNLTYGSATITLVTIEKWRQMALPGDVNADGTVNALDTTIITTNNNTDERNWWQGDVTGDGLVNSADAAIVAANQGRAVGSNRWIKQAGTWTTNSNWASNSAPNAVGATAHLGSSITANSDLTINSAITLGQVVFDNAKSYNLTGTGSLKFQASGSTPARVFVVQGTQKIGVPATVTSSTEIDVAGGAALQFNKSLAVNVNKALIQSGAGTVTFNDIVSIGGGGQYSIAASSTAVFTKQVGGTNIFTGSGTKIFQGGTSSIGPIATTGATIVEGTAQLSAASIRESSLTVRGGLARVLSSGTDAATSKVSALTISTPGILDITNNKLIVDYTGATPLPAIRGYVHSGRGGTDFANATWNGAGGIVSSTAAAGDKVSFAVGYVENSYLPQLGLPSYSTFGGQAADSSSVLVRYTKGADANLDGKVNSDDVTIVGALYNNAGSGQWYLGDFDFDGKCDTDDVTVLGALYDATAPALSEAQLTAQYGEEFAAAFERGRSATAVPEPALSGVGCAFFALMARTRRSRARQV